MPDYGMFVKGDDGSLLVTPDTPCYELIGEYQPVSRVGNVNTYSVPSSNPPLVFICVEKGHSGGVLSVIYGTNSWIIEVLATRSCSILAFKTISGTASGYGLAVYAGDGSLVFDSTRNVLNVRDAGNLAQDVSFPCSAVADSVCYTSGPVYAEQSNADRWQVVDYYSYLAHTYQCDWKNVCEPVLTCGFVTKCTLQYVCSGFGASYSCSFVNVCSQVFECSYPIVCALKYVCDWVMISVSVTIWARVRRTTWTIKRGTAKLLTTSNSVGFNWVTHKNGYYDTILRLTSSESATVFGEGTPPTGYIPFATLYQDVEVYEGELSSNDTFPYTTETANTGQLVCLTTARSNYV